MKITLKDGSVFEGTAKEYAELAKLVEGLAETKDEYVPKVGDYVVALPSADEKYYITNSEMRLGKVKDVQDDLIDIEILDHSERKGFVGEDFYVESKHFRKATDEEVAKIEDKEEDKSKQGDIVVITGNTNGSRNKVGDIGKVGETAYSTAEVNVPSRPYSRGVNGNNTIYEEMRPATEEEKEKYYAELNKSEFKGGDYARIKLDVKHDGYAGGGDIIKLYDNSNGLYDFKVVKLGGDIVDEYSFFDAYDLEKVSEEELKFAKLGRKPGEFKKGDIFKGAGGRISQGIFEVVEIREEGSHPIRFINRDGDNDGFSLKAEIELVAPVESRVDLND